MTSTKIFFFLLSVMLVFGYMPSRNSDVGARQVTYNNPFPPIVCPDSPIVRAQFLVDSYNQRQVVIQQNLKQARIANEGIQAQQVVVEGQVDTLASLIKTGPKAVTKKKTVRQFFQNLLSLK